MGKYESDDFSTHFGVVGHADGLVAVGTDNGCADDVVLRIGAASGLTAAIAPLAICSASFRNTTAYFYYGLYGWIEEWFKRGMQETPKEMAQLWEKAQQENK